MSRTCRKSSAMRLWPALACLAALAAAGPVSADVADHLIISEVVNLTNTDDPRRPLCSEFIEIVNPTALPVALDDVYLTDGTYNTGGVGYWLIAVDGADGATAGGGSFSDFHARFPAGAVIAAGDTIVVSVAGSDEYADAYDRLPDFELFEDGDVPDTVPEMREAFPGGINAGALAGGTNNPTLTDGSESLVMYTWDGATNLVADLDYVRWGTSTSVVVDKTGQIVGGETYLDDTIAASQATVTVTTQQGMAMQRASADEGTETLTGGNGLTGHDETSENFGTTWAWTAQDPALAPVAHLATAPVIGAMVQEPAEPVAGQPAVITLPVAAETSVTGVEFRYTLDGGAETALAGSETTAGSGLWTATIPGQPEGVDVAWYAVATGANGGTSTYPAAAPRYTRAWTVQAVPPPVISEAGFTPAEPYDGQDVTLSVTATSITPITAVTFKVSYDGGAYGDVAGADQGGGVYTAVLTSQVEGTVVAWYVEVTNDAALTATWPADAPTTTEGWTVDEAPDPNAFPAKLLLTEICTQFTAIEFVEIHNPNDRDVDLSDYYLADANYTPDRQHYWRIAEGNPQFTTVGGGQFADFHSRFPDGYTIAAGDTIVVSIGGSAEFVAEFGFLPDLEMYEDDAFADAVPDMRWIWGDETNNSIFGTTGDGTMPTLSNGAETVILYNWKEGEDKVTDIDLFHWREPGSTSTSFLFTKTGETVGSHSYLPDTAIDLQTPFAAQAPIGQSYQRIDASEGAQLATGSNGVFGRDETSEDFNNTFAVMETDPSRPGGSSSSGDGMMELSVEPKTFLPSLGEIFPIKFTSKPRTETRLRLYDREGRLVKTLFDSRFNGPPSVIPGAYTTVPWDGLDDTFQPVPGGMYIIHLSVVDNETGEEEFTTAPVVVATRLNK